MDKSITRDRQRKQMNKRENEERSNLKALEMGGRKRDKRKLKE